MNERPTPDEDESTPSMFDHDDIEIEIEMFPKQEGPVRKGRWFSEVGLRTRDEAIIEATCAIYGVMPYFSSSSSATLDAIIAAAEAGVSHE